MSHGADILGFFSNIPSAEERLWKKGSYICREGMEMERFHLLISGSCRIFRDLNNGRTVLYRIYLPGSIIGDIEVFYGTEASCSVQCISDVKTLSVSIAVIRKNPDRYSDLVFYLGRGLARKLHENSLSEALNVSYTLETRLAHYFLTTVEPGLAADSLGRLSGWMGCSYRHLTRILSELGAKGGIRRGPSGRWEAGDTGVLTEIAAPLLQEEKRVLFEPGETADIFRE